MLHFQRKRNRERQKTDQLLSWAGIGIWDASGYDRNFSGDGNVLEVNGADGCTIYFYEFYKFIHLFEIITLYS